MHAVPPTLPSTHPIQVHRRHQDRVRSDRGAHIWLLHEALGVAGACWPGGTICSMWKKAVGAGLSD